MGLTEAVVRGTDRLIVGMFLWAALAWLILLAALWMLGHVLPEGW